MSDVIQEMIDPSEALAAYDAGEISEDELEELCPGCFELDDDEYEDSEGADRE